MIDLTRLAKPTFTQIKWTTLVLAVFFTLVSTAQYWFVRWQTREATLETLLHDAQEINTVLDYSSAPDLAGYNKAFIEANTFQVINQDGTVIDTEGGASAYVPDFLPMVQMPWLSSTDGKPVPYVSPLGEHWTILTVPIAGGYGVLGVSEFDDRPNPNPLLLDNAKYLPPGVGSLSFYNGNKFDNDVSHAVVSKEGKLLRAGGHIPFHVDPMAVGKQSAESGDKLGKNETPYYVVYTPITDRSGKEVGTVIAYQNVAQQQGVIRNMLWFSLGNH